MQQTVEQLLAAARGHHSRGEFAAAVKEYEKAARAARQHPAVVSELISAQLAAGETDAAIKAARKLAADYPREAAAHLLFAQALAQGPEPRRALPEFERASRLAPSSPDAPALQGMLHARLGEHDLSEACFRAALDRVPGHPGLLTNLGHSLKAQSKLKDAASAYRQALDRQLEAPTLTAFAEVATGIGRTAEGIALLEKGIAQLPPSAELHHALGNLYQDEGRLADAAAQQERALELKPDLVDAAHNLGAVEIDLAHWDRAVAALERAIALEPEAPDHYSLLIGALEITRDDEHALRVAAEAVIRTGKDEFRMSHAHLQRFLGRFDQAIEEYRAIAEARAATADEIYWDARLHVALNLLAKGELAAGWPEFANREDRRQRGRRDPRAVLDPVGFFRDAAGARAPVLVDMEQGIGDQLFLLRFAGPAQAVCGRLLVAVDPKLRPMLRRSGVPFELIDKLAEAAACEAQVWLSDLALACPPSYARPLPVSPDPALVEEVGAALARCGPPPYVAVTWRAGMRMLEGPENARRYLKDLDAAALARALRGCAATVIVLQRGLLPGEGEAFASTLGRDAFDFSGYSDDLERMLALLSLLDDYVTVSNTNVHLLAGVGGKSARVLVPFPAEWRWHEGDRESPWFPGFALYREDRAQRWTRALDSLVIDLRARLPTQQPAGSGRLVPAVPSRRYSAEDPSPRYRALLDLYRQMHAQEDIFAGTSLPWQAARIKAIVERTRARSILDYGSGKGRFYAERNPDIPGVGRVPSLQEYWGVDSIRCYDPAYAPFSEAPAQRFDGVITTDVLEHCPEDDLEWIVARLFSYATRFVFANVASYPASKQLPTGENAHITQRGPKFWADLFGRIARAHPGVDWEVHVAMRGPAGAMIHKQVSGSG